MLEKMLSDCSQTAKKTNQSIFNSFIKRINGYKPHAELSVLCIQAVLEDHCAEQIVYQAHNAV